MNRSSTFPVALLAVLGVLPAAAQVTVRLASPANLVDLRVNQAVDLRIELANLPANTRLALLNTTVAFDSATLGTPSALLRGGIVPNPLFDPLDFLAAAAAGSADVSFFTLSTNLNHQIRQSGTFATFRVTPRAQGEGTIRLSFVDALAFDPGDLGLLRPLTVTVAPGLPFVVRPPNDRCTDAIDLPDSTAFQFDTTFASSDGPDEPAIFSTGSHAIDRDIWYRYSPSIGGTVRLALCGSTFDTRVAVYQETCPGAPGTAIVGDDDSCGDTASRLTFTGQTGVNYLIRLGGNPIAGPNSRGLGAITIQGCPADFNRDGGVDGGDIESFFASWESGYPESDVNEDGGIDGADVGDFLYIWENVAC